MTEPTESRPEVAEWTELEVAGLGGLGDEVLDAILAELSRRIALPVRRVLVALDPPARTVPGRRQLDADHLLTRLETAGSSTRPLIAVTDEDLALPIFTFVFGRARLGGTAALVSLARLRPEFYGLAADPDRVARRAVAEILHELGHVAGLEHCSEPDCLMRFAASVEAADLRGDRFCEACSERLPEPLRHPEIRPGAQL
ncbi:MAG TPA: archemetzincin [Thermoanaerobaculia bacterium]|nr:archemetzincin [Thermoanaerobaculia bacterium]